MAGIIDLDTPNQKPRGREFGDKRILTAAQEAKIKVLLIDKSPALLKIESDSGLWTKEFIRAAIKQKFSVALSLSTLNDYLERWGLTPQMPYKRATKENKKAYRRWYKAEYPGILDRSKKEKAEIHWCDYCDVKSEADNGTIIPPIGRVPKGNQNIDHSNIKMLSTITNRGKKRFMLLREPMTTTDFYKFLDRLTRECKRKVFLILYNHQAHYSKLVDGLLLPRKKNNHKPQIELFYLPSNLPEHNPIEETLTQIPNDILIKEKEESRPSIAKNLSGDLGMVNIIVGRMSRKEIDKFHPKKTIAKIKKYPRKKKPTF